MMSMAMIVVAIIFLREKNRRECLPRDFFSRCYKHTHTHNVLKPVTKQNQNIGSKYNHK